MAILVRNNQNLDKKLGIQVIKDHIYQTFDMGDLENWISVDHFDTIVFDVSNYIGSSHLGWIDFEAIYNQTGIYKYKFIGKLPKFNVLTIQHKNKQDEDIYKKLEFEFIPEKKYQYVEIYINHFGEVEGNVQINPSIGGGYYDEGKGVWKIMEEDTFNYYSELFKKQEFPLQFNKIPGVINRPLTDYLNSPINRKNSKLLFKDILVPGTLYQLPIDRKKYLIIKGNFERSFYKYIDDRGGAQTLKKEHFKLLMEDIYVWQYS